MANSISVAVADMDTMDSGRSSRVRSPSAPVTVTGKSAELEAPASGCFAAGALLQAGGPRRSTRGGGGRDAAGGGGPGGRGAPPGGGGGRGGRGPPRGGGRARHAG